MIISIILNQITLFSLIVFPINIFQICKNYGSGSATGNRYFIRIRSVIGNLVVFDGLFHFMATAFNFIPFIIRKSVFIFIV
ncbi:hypothetical protein DN564_31045, partial [Burkholderia multivorans]